MPKLNEAQVSYEQVLDLVRQLRPEQRMSLMVSLMGGGMYRDALYRYAEKLAQERGFSHLSEGDVERLLHEEKG